jgi:hypothetical protein
MITNYEEQVGSFPNFAMLSGVKTESGNFVIKWLLTGVSEGIDMGWMPTREGRRDFGVGISGFQGAAEPKTCFTELKIIPTSPPPFTYLVTLTGNLKGLDIRSAGDHIFSGDYYNKDRTKSQAIINANATFINSEGYQILIRISAAAKEVFGTYETVFSIFPSAIPYLGIQTVEPLGESSPPIEIRWPDGKKETSDNYYLPI